MGASTWRLYASSIGACGARCTCGLCHARCSPLPHLKRVPVCSNCAPACSTCADLTPFRAEWDPKDPSERLIVCGRCVAGWLGTRAAGIILGEVQCSLQD